MAPDNMAIITYLHVELVSLMGLEEEKFSDYGGKVIFFLAVLSATGCLPDRDVRG